MRGRARRAFHKISTAINHPTAEPEPPECKWLDTKYLCEVEYLWQDQENNTTFTFWLLPRRIPGVYAEKVRESGWVRMRARRANYASQRTRCFARVTQILMWAKGARIQDAMRFL